MGRALRTIALVFICGMLACAPRSPVALRQAGLPGAKVIYHLYATDGYVRLDDGQSLHIFGFIGGREGEPLTYLDETGEAQTLVQGPPEPAPGPLTAAEAALLGHAQLLAPLIWAGTNDVVEVRLKNLGGAAAGSPAAPLGIEFRGLAVSAYAEGAPETSVLAIPVASALPGSGNVLVYTLRAANPGTYAYGWSYGDHMGHDAPAGAQAGSAAQAMAMGCSCPMMRMGSSQSMPMNMGSASQSLLMGASGPVYSTLDGALVVYEAADAAAQTGPGMGAGGAILGLRYDQDFVMLITGGHDASTGMAGMPGMSMAAESQVLLVNGSLPGQFSPEEAGRPVQAHYSPFVPRAGQEARRVLVRILNLSGRPQPLDAITQGYRPTAYQSHQLAWASPAAARAWWAEGSQAPGDAQPAYDAIGPGESMDVLLNLGAPRPAGADRLAATQFNSAAGPTAGALGSSTTAAGMAGGMLPGMPMTGTLPGMAMCSMTGGMAPDVNGAVTCGAAGCPMMRQRPALLPADGAGRVLQAVPVSAAAGRP